MPPCLGHPTRRRWLGAALWSLAGPAAVAQPRRPLPTNENWEPLDEIGGITAWFRRMSAEFDRYVAKEQRAQLWRSVDKLRKALYQLEQDSLALRDLVPDASPTEPQRAALTQQTAALLSTVRALGAHLREIGADLRLSDPQEMWRVEERIGYGFRAREMALSLVQRELARSRDGAPWPAAELRDRLTKGILAIRDAQKAVVAFHGQLNA